jgi:uncharacterized protein YkwD
MHRLTAVCIIFALLIPAQAKAVFLNESQLLLLREYIHSLINESRSAENVPNLTYDNEIERVAQAHADDTASHFDPTSVETREETYLAHTSSDGRALRARYRDAEVDTGWAFAENVGYWTRAPYGDPLEASEFGILLMHEGMMAEVPPNDSHRVNVLGDFSHIGVGLSLLNEQTAISNAIFLVTNYSRYSGEEEEREKRAALEPTSPRSLLRAVTYSHNGPFSDVRTTDPFSKAISAMKELGIIRGYDDGTFQPERTVNRAEILKMLLDIKGESPIGREFSACFSDVFNQWFAPYVCVSKRNGWVTGYPDGSFKPDQAVNRAEAVTLASRILEPVIDIKDLHPFDDVPEDIWFYLPLQSLASNFLLPFEGSIFHPMRGMQRGEVAEMIYRTNR